MQKPLFELTEGVIGKGGKLLNKANLHEYYELCRMEFGLQSLQLLSNEIYNFASIYIAFSK